MNVFLTTLGCRLNEAEIATWSRTFASKGHLVVRSPADAQLMVINTCAVTAEAARKSRKLIGGLHRKNPSASLVVTGCFAALEADRAAELAGVDLVVGNANKETLVGEIEAKVNLEAMPELASEPGAAHIYANSSDTREERTRAFIKVQDGCRNRCTFCIVTIARGEERSRPVSDIVDEIAVLNAEGCREVVLTGVHLGGYGSDLGTDLKTLTGAVLADTDIPRVRLSSLEPWDLPDGFETLWENSRLMPHLHLPLQSGSDSLLKRMARRCYTDEYERLVTGLRASIPNVQITTDVIVGFPGETDAEWRATIDYVERIGFSHIHVFSYSHRDGTTAARMSGHVPSAIKRTRSAELHQLAAKMKKAALADAVGQTRSVLWEGNPVELDEGRATWRGYTDNYLRVASTCDRSAELSNQIELVRISEVAENGEHLIASRSVSVR